MGKNDEIDLFWLRLQLLYVLYNGITAVVSIAIYDAQTIVWAVLLLGPQQDDAVTLAYVLECYLHCLRMGVYNKIDSRLC